MKNATSFVNLFIFALGISGCQQSNSTHFSPSHQDKVMTSAPSGSKQNLLTLTGTLRYLQIEGGFFGFESDNGKKYTFKGLEPTLRVANIRLKVTGFIREDIMTTTQYGSVLEVVSAVKTGNALPKASEL